MIEDRANKQGAVSQAGRPGSGGIDWAEVGTLAVILVAVWWLWPTWVVTPLKILVVFFHELSHAAAALLTGGSVVDIELSPQQGGLARTAGGSRFLILSAGYLGSLVWGGVILLAAARSRADRWVSLGLAGVLLVATLLWVRPLLGFGFGFSLAAALAPGACGLWLSHRVNDFLLKTIGLTSLFYAVLDIRDDILARPHLVESDAARLAAMTGIPTLVWGGLWMVLAVVAAGVFLRSAARAR